MNATVADLSLLVLREELRSWKERGVQFGITKDGSISYVMDYRSLALKSEADTYRAEHRNELLNYLAFTAGRNEDDAWNHLQYARRQRDRWINGEQSRRKPVTGDAA